MANVTEPTWENLISERERIAATAPTCTCRNRQYGHHKDCPVNIKAVALGNLDAELQSKADTEGPNWPIEIAPCRFPTRELGLQHGAVKVIPAEWMTLLLDALDAEDEASLPDGPEAMRTVERMREELRERGI